MITSDDVNRMMIEIGAGLPWGDRRSQVPRTAEHRAEWETIERQMRAIRRRGRIVDIPAEIPDPTGFEPGTI